ncbi:MAG: hydroxysqualene dehydroxylase HpnE [Pirellulaceae bacterium]
MKNTTKFNYAEATCSVAPQSASQIQSIVVIGGGLAGIAASLRLAQRGFAVTLLESKRRLGGRAGSFTRGDEKHEQEIDYCQHVGMGCCHGLLELIRMLGHEAFWDRHRELHFYGPDGKYSKLGALPFLPAPLHIAKWLTSWPGLRLRERIQVARGMLAIRALDITDPTALDTPALDWLHSVKQSTATIERFWATVIVSALGETVDRVSLYAVAKVFQDGFLNQRDAFHLLVPNRPLNQLFNLTTIESLRSAGVDVRVAERVREINRGADGGFEVRGARETFAADQVIVALPWHTLDRIKVTGPDREEQIFGELADRALELESSPITGLHTWWDRPWLDKPHATLVGRLCQWVFPKTGSQTLGPFAQSERPNDEGSNAPSQYYYQIVISASRDLSEIPKRQLPEVIQEDLAHVFPIVREKASLIACEPVTDPHSVFSVRAGASKLRSETDSGIQGLWLAGDWTQTGWPATMESAVLSGFEAARATEEWGVTTTTHARKT